MGAIFLACLAHNQQYMSQFSVYVTRSGQVDSEQVDFSISWLHVPYYCGQVDSEQVDSEQVDSEQVD